MTAYETDLAFARALGERIAASECLCPVWLAPEDYTAEAYDAACAPCPAHGAGVAS